MPVCMYDSETMLWKVEKSRIRAIQMDKIRGLLGIRRMNKVWNAQIRQLCRVTEVLMKLSSDGSAMWREMRMSGLIRGSV